MPPRFDTVVVGSCVMDLLCGPVALDTAIGAGTLHAIEPPRAIPGGITSNAGIAMARLGLRVGVASYVGDDAWGTLLRDTLTREGVDTQHLATHPDAPTSTTVVLVDQHAERSFLHAQGAPKRIDAAFFRERMHLWREAGWVLLGYYPLLPMLIGDLPEVVGELRAAGCRTALDSAGGATRGGSLESLAPVLPHLDLYIPSLGEAQTQTGEDDPSRMIKRYREGGAAGIVGVKLGGAEGVLISETPGTFHHQPSDTAPGPAVDTTGAGDCFLAGMIAGLVQGRSIRDAAALGTRAAAQSVTRWGGWPGVERTGDG